MFNAEVVTVCRVNLSKLTKKSMGCLHFSVNTSVGLLVNASVDPELIMLILGAKYKY